ncbi:hypothetical protein B0T21DRAFT_410641 [Apiosordaria backusii]|uniref:Heterokaryon incompatibility domain-containing protein n=1 Tax=Apiosordaria backusii TaxID=314023 RepID=A0AA40BMY9_9PEZI|nr:hypothetical protein B0T21DRAFT_410641 [Apiosordaria backusii]
MASHSPMSPSACQVCGDLNRQDTRSFSCEIKELITSSSDGCTACEILWKALSHSLPHFHNKSDSIYVEKQQDPGPLRLTYSYASPAMEAVEIYCHADSPTAYSWIGPSTEVSLDSSGMRKASGSSLTLKLVSSFSSSETPKPELEPQRKYYEAPSTWSFIVSAYTARKLTYISDRLPGLSGIATCWEHSETDTYLAGLWLRDLPRHLMWSAGAIDPNLPPRGSLRHTEYYAPTWSWASISGAVHHYPEPLELQVRIVECKTEPSTFNRFGPVRSGHLKLPYSAWRLVRAIDARMGRNDQFLGDIEPDVEMETGDLPEINEQETYYLLPLGTDHTYTSIPVVSLVLRQSPSLPNTYTRLGLLSTKYDGDWKNFSDGAQETEVTVL